MEVIGAILLAVLCGLVGAATAYAGLVLLVAVTAGLIKARLIPSSPLLRKP